MRRAPEGGDACGDAGERIGAVEPAMRTVEVEAFCSWSACRMKMRSIARASTGLTLYFSARHAEGHAQEILGVVSLLSRIHEGLADRVFVAPSRRASAFWRSGGCEAISRCSDR